MSQKNETLVLGLALIITMGILGGGYWWFTNKNQLNSINNSNSTNPPLNNSNSSFPTPTNVPRGTTIKIDGSTSMVQINQTLKNAFELQFPSTTVNTQAGGSTKGINDLIIGNVDLAAISRPLNAQETQQGLVAIPVTQDAIALVVGINNPFHKSLTKSQIVDIFTGKITNWSQLGGVNTPIKVINRPSVSGTNQAFQELVLGGASFGQGGRFIQMTQDATTPILQALGKDGISYATSSQVINQQTVRTVAVEGLTTEASSYPYQRTLFYVYREPANTNVQYFLGFMTSPKGVDIINNQN